MTTHDVRPHAGAGAVVRSAARALAAGCSVLALSAGASHAQQAAPATAAAPQPPSLDELIVTAQRREERLQDVPIAVSGYTQEFLASRNVTSFQGIAGFTPNVKIVVTNRNSAPAVSMRGSVTINPAPSFEPTVALYSDGVYLSKQYGSLIDTADIDHIEVLRGPQGTLFGRNTLAGAINIVSRKPTGVFGGTMKVGVGNYNSRLARASVDLPAFGDLSIKLSGSYNAHDGYVNVRPQPFTNVRNAGPAQASRFGDIDNKAFRLAARYAPTQNLTVDYTLDYSQANDTMGFSQPTFVSPGGIFDPASASYIGGYNAASNTYAGNPYNLYLFPNHRSDFGYEGGTFQNGLVKGKPLEENTRNRLHALTVTYEVGEVTLTSITSYRSLDHAWWNDTDGAPLNLLSSALTMHYNTFSQEFQATGQHGPIKYTGGLYYFSDDGAADNPQQYFGGNIFLGGYSFTTKAYAAYGQLEYSPEFAPNLTLVGGLRYSTEKKGTERDWRSVNATTGALVSVLVPAGTSASANFHGLTPAVTVKYQLTPDINVYARYAKGFKSGGFNGDATSVAESTTPFRPESVDSYELGAKARFLDGRLQTNVAAFIDKHQDMQLSVFLGAGTLASGIRNAGRAEIRGIEVEAQAIPFDWLRVNGSIGTLNAKYQEFIDGGVNVANDRAFPYTPKMTASINVDATVFRSQIGELHLLVDYTHSDPYFEYPYTTRPDYRTLTADTTKADSSDIYDVRLRLTDIPVANGSLEASLWVKNIFDDSNRISGIDFGPSFGHATISYYDAPRTFGADLSWKF